MRHSWACKNPDCRPLDGECFDQKKGPKPLCEKCGEQMDYGWGGGTSYYNIAQQGWWSCRHCVQEVQL